MKPDSKLFEKEMSLKVEFPYTVTNSIISKLIKRDGNDMSNVLKTLYV